MSYMKRKVLLIFLILFTCVETNAQKIDFSYGVLLGINSTSLFSKTGINYDYLNENAKNIYLNTSTTSSLGYSEGFFFKLQPVTNRLSLETGFLISNYNVVHSISLTYDHWVSYMGSWEHFEATELLKHEFCIINIPLTLGFDLNKNSKYKFTVLFGAVYNVSIKNDKDFITDIERIPLYKDSYFSYQSGIMANFNRILCKINYERSFNIQNAPSQNKFTWEMNVKKIYYSVISITVGFQLN